MREVSKCSESLIGSSNMARWDSLTSEEDNGENKVTDAYGMELLRLIEGSPQEHGYRRPTWTQELLVLVLAERSGIHVSVTTICRLLRQLRIRLNRPKTDG